MTKKQSEFPRSPDTPTCLDPLSVGVERRPSSRSEPRSSKGYERERGEIEMGKREIIEGERESTLRRGPTHLLQQRQAVRFVRHSLVSGRLVQCTSRAPPGKKARRLGSLGPSHSQCVGRRCVSVYFSFFPHFLRRQAPDVAVINLRPRRGNAETKWGRWGCRRWDLPRRMELRRMRRQKQEEKREEGKRMGRRSIWGWGRRRQDLPRGNGGVATGKWKGYIAPEIRTKQGWREAEKLEMGKKK